MPIVAGLDVGGAHLKVALTEDGRTIAVEQFFCPLWLGMDRLDDALAAAAPLTTRASRFAVTMTGELSDLFEDRRTGVAALVERVCASLGADAHFWMGQRGFGTHSDAVQHSGDVASANFLATAVVVARRTPSALLIDIGSTTTDIIPVVEGKPVPSELTDGGRLASGELVYTGLTRTAVMAVAGEAPFKGARQRLCREYFATMADVRRVLGELPDGFDQHATADGRGKSQAESVARLARMFGRDAYEGTLEDWQTSARVLVEAQRSSIIDGCWQVLLRAPLAAEAPVVAAGIGASLARDIGFRLGHPCRVFGEIANADKTCEDAATFSAPAVAVALLLDEGFS